MIGCQRILMPAAVWLCLAAPAAAHPILIHSGAIEWTDEGMRLTLSLEPHSLQHESLALGNTLARGRLAYSLAESIRILAQQGNTLTTTRISLGKDGLEATCEYAIPSAETTLILLHRPGPELAGIARQLRLVWTPPDCDDTRVLRLTSGGNHVVLQRGDAIEKAPTHRAPFNEPVLRIIANREAAVPGIVLDFPCTLLATWENLITCDNDTVNGRVFQTEREALAAWGRAHLSTAAADCAATPVSIDRVELLGASGEIIADDDDTPRSVYASRVRWHVRSPEVDHDVDAARDWTWTGFNAAVLSLPVVVERDTYSMRLGVLTSAQATARIEQTDPIRVRIRKTPSKDTMRRGSPDAINARSSPEGEATR